MNFNLLTHPLLFYIRSNLRPFILGVFFLILTNLFDGVTPFLLKNIIDLIISSAHLQQIHQNLIYYFVTMVFLAISRYGWRYFFGTYHTLAAENLRNIVFRKFLSLDSFFYGRTTVGELMSLISNDVNSFRNAIGPGLLILMDAVLGFIMILPFMYTMNKDWTWKTLIFLPVVPLLIWKVMQLIHVNYKKEQDQFAELSGYSLECISGIRPIKGFHQEENRLNKYNVMSREYERISNRTGLIDALFIPVMQFGVASGTVILLFIAAPDMIAGTVTIGTFVAFQRYIDKIVWPVTALGYGLSNFQKGMASFSRIKNILQATSQIQDDGSLNLGPIDIIKFENVSYTYPTTENPTLKNIDFQICNHENIGILGAVGSGKSTLVSLLLRLIEPTEGRILINDIDYRKYSLSSLRKQIKLISQEPFLFNTSIKNNLLYGDLENHYPQHIQSITDMVQLTEEINALPQNFETELGEKGINLSGGQKQRMTIGRGLASNSQILILDDSLSAVDIRTEKSIIHDHLKKEKSHHLIIITHRLPIVENFDKLLVLNQGRMEACGSFDEVFTTSPTLKKMGELQGLPHE